LRFRRRANQDTYQGTYYQDANQGFNRNSTAMKKKKGKKDAISKVNHQRTNTASFLFADRTIQEDSYTYK